ncbi:non-ribosomal peptide synthetase, partial [Rhodococcus opacus PD630]
MRLDIGAADLDEAFAGGAAAGVVVKSIKEQLRSIPDRGIGYGLLRYLNRDTAEQLRSLPVGQISFNYLGRVSGRVYRTRGRGRSGHRAAISATSPLREMPTCRRTASSTSTRSSPTAARVRCWAPRSRSRRVQSGGPMCRTWRRNG